MIDNIKSVLVFILVFVFCSNGYLALETINPAIKEVYWYLLLFGLSSLMLLLTPMEAISNVPKAVFIWIILFILSTVFAYALSSRGPTVTRELSLLLKAISAFFSMFVLVTNRQTLKAAYAALILVILVGATVNVVEFFSDQIEWSSIPGRAAGWYVNANKSGKYLVMSLIFASIVTPKKLLWPLITITAFGVLFTFSRSAWIELFVVIVGISMINNTPAGQKISFLDIKPAQFIALVIGGTIASLLLISLFSGQAYEMIKDTPLEEYLSKDTIGRMSGEFTDDSANEREEVLVEALKYGLDAPLHGQGLSFTYEWDQPVAPHNDYAKLFAERGITGPLLYLTLLGILWFTGGRHAKLFVMVLAFTSIATHNTLEQPGIYIFMALALLTKDDQADMKLGVAEDAQNFARSTG